MPLCWMIPVKSAETVIRIRLNSPKKTSARITESVRFAHELRTQAIKQRKIRISDKPKCTH